MEFEAKPSGAKLNRPKAEWQRGKCTLGAIATSCGAVTNQIPRPGYAAGLKARLSRGAAIVGALLFVCNNVDADSWPTYGTLMDGNVRPDIQVDMLSHSDRLFPVNIVHRKGPIQPLAGASHRLDNVHYDSGGRTYDLFDYLATNRVAGLLVLKDGKIAFEDYELGVGPKTRWASFSMAKSFTSTLIGVALKQGLIHSLDDDVVQYVPSLKGGAYDGVSIRNVLEMTSGVKWDETYTDAKSDQRQLAAIRERQQAGSILAYMKALPRVAPPGQVWNYNTGETFIAGAVVEGATHKSLAQFLTESIWSHLGMEQDATWWLESPRGAGFGGAGLAATLRDYGRFGLFVINDGRLESKSILPDHWFREAGSPHEFGEKRVNYGYQWWTMASTDIVHDQAFEALGLFGQHIYLNPREKVVIVALSARPKGARAARALIDDDFFAAVVKALR